MYEITIGEAILCGAFLFVIGAICFWFPMIFEYYSKNKK